MRAIEVEQLTKVYGKTRAVDGISFNVEKGEIFGMIGPLVHPAKLLQIYR